MDFCVFGWNNEIYPHSTAEDKTVLTIIVTIVSGDETVDVIYTDGTVQTFSAVTASEGLYDGSYWLAGVDIVRWMEWFPKELSPSATWSYDRQEEFG